LDKAAPDITLTLMTPCRVTETAPGELTLQPAAVKVSFDASSFRAITEEVPITDAHLRSAWGDRLYRVLLKCEKPPLQADWRMLIRTASA